MFCQHCKKRVEERFKFCGYCGVQLADINAEVPLQKTNGKVFNDPIHGHIRLPSACVQIIDTLQFQRLRHIKQLDACYLVYPGASHNRFEHSLGVCHLAGKLLRAIKERQPDEDLMSDKDILCVEIAGLCHDLGQGPFSHVFEKDFIPQVFKDDPEYKNWKHEKAAVMMFENILQDNNGKIKTQLQAVEDLDDKDLTFIKELIDVPKNLDAEEWPYQGRQREHSFLYEVVANGKHGIDVDKWDYLARDSYMLGIKSNFDHNRCIANAKILVADGRKQICYRDKAVYELYGMFNTRLNLHMRAYQHKTHKSIGKIIADTIKDPEAYTKLTDDVLHTIQLSDKPELERANAILNSIRARNIYVFVTETLVKMKEGVEFDKETSKEEILDKIKCEGITHVDVGSIYFDFVTVDYGMKNKNPMRNVRFFSKEYENPFSIDEKQVSFFLPPTFGEIYVRVYCKNREDHDLLHKIREGFKNWCIAKKLSVPKGF